MSVNDVQVGQEFKAIDLQDQRLNRRCRELATSFARQPEAPINQACGDWSDTKAAYRFFANEKVTPERIGQPHYQRTAGRLKRYERVLAIQDTTFFNYTHHPQTEGLGAIGNKRQKQRGFGMHSTQAVAPTGLPLGLLDQRWLFRPIDAPSVERNELRKLPIEAKESYRWLQALECAEALAPPEVQLVHVGDAEADIYEFFVRAQALEASFLVRASGDRSLLTADENDAAKLWSSLEEQAVLSQRHIHVTGNQKRSARQAQVVLRTAEVTLKPPYRPKGQQLPPVTVRAVLVREENPPSAEDEPIEWLLLTNLPLERTADALCLVDWYCLRWHIEEFHKILKSGCRVEDCRLQTANRLQNYIVLMSVIAWRLHWLTYLNRVAPDAPCTLALTTVEWQALYMHLQQTTVFPDTPPTVREALRWIAQLGGFLARTGDGQPGNTVIWRGWQRLHDLAATWSLVKEQSPSTYG